MDEMLILCRDISVEAHKGQLRRGGKDYFTHPEAVANVLVDPMAKCVAYLHDVIEDTEETSGSLLSKGVREDIVTHVLHLTKHPDTAYTDYIGRIRVCPICKKVKIADMLHNLGDSPSKRQQEKYTKGIFALVEENNG